MVMITSLQYLDTIVYYLFWLCLIHTHVTPPASKQLQALFFQSSRTLLYFR